MKNLIKKIEVLEAKRDNGTITIGEDVILIQLIDLATNFIFCK